MHRHADAELTSLLTDTAPPPNPSVIDLFKRHFEKYNQKAPGIFWIGFACMFLLNTPNVFVLPASDCRSMRNAPQRLRSLLDAAPKHDKTQLGYLTSTHQLIQSRIIRSRLSAALLQTTWSQTELDVQSDLDALRQWASKFHVFASQQAENDVQIMMTHIQRYFKLQTLDLFFVRVGWMSCTSRPALSLERPKWMRKWETCAKWFATRPSILPMVTSWRSKPNLDRRRDLPALTYQHIPKNNTLMNWTPFLGWPSWCLIVPFGQAVTRLECS